MHACARETYGEVGTIYHILYAHVFICGQWAIAYFFKVNAPKSILCRALAQPKQIYKTTRPSFVSRTKAQLKLSLERPNY